MPPSRRLLLICATLLLTLALGGCAASNGPPRTWTELNLPGAVLRLDSETNVKELRFLGELTGGWVTATIGTRGGPLTAPVFPWRIEGNFLVIGQGKEFERLEFLRLESEHVVARRSTGGVVLFRRFKAWIPSSP